ncbi:MAG: autoinducer-2 (AI-2E) family exporter [Idiomarinaceae bacterium HL-53]|nr:MAG: autoinducer-2 (AI-2E) family exporter [Idiomarinaceae bacterium HL-53]CUS48625.1 Predicted PurR-regulated permease PerM [Idiomarinaceae bacterium HL-53]
MQSPLESFGPVSRLFIIFAAVVIVLAGLKAASVIIVPLLLAIFIAVIMQPMLIWFKARGFPTILAIAAVFIIISVFAFGLTMLIVQSVNEFSASFPEYRERITGEFGNIVELLARFNIHISQDVLQSQLDPSRIMTFMMSMLSGLGGMMTNAFLVILIVVFILGEAANLPKKIALAFDKADDQLHSLSSLLLAINKYLALKTAISLITGLAIGFGLWVMGVDHYVLWGVLAFVLNYIPNIGSILAAVPAIILALIQYHPAMASAVALLFLAVNVIMGNLVEPKVMGQRLGLSTLVVFLSLIFWGWMLGPVGMLLSVPLTMMVKIGLQENPDTRWLAILLGGDEVIHNNVVALTDGTEEGKEK